MKIAIFGASGKIGSKIVDLLSDTHEVIKMDIYKQNIDTHRVLRKQELESEKESIEWSNA